MSELLKSQTIDSIVESLNNPKIIKPGYIQKEITEPSEYVKSIATNLHLFKHPEGGYYNETDRSPLLMESPYYPGHNTGHSSEEPLKSASNGNSSKGEEHLVTSESGEKLTPLRNYSTLIHYLITCESPVGRLHFNKSRIIHILQKGRGQYVLIYPDGKIKTFIVGFNFAKGEVNQWVVPGGVYKASFLIPLDESKESESESGNDHLLISEVVVPGFEFEDHKFMSGKQELVDLVGDKKADELFWLLG